MKIGKTKTNKQKPGAGAAKQSPVNRPLVWLCAPAAAMLLLANVWPLWAAGLITVSAVLGLITMRQSKKAVLLFTGAVIALVWFWIYLSLITAQSYPFAGRTAPFTATVTDYSRRTQYQSSVDVRVDAIAGTSIPARLYISIDEELVPGDRIVGNASFTSGLESGNGYSSYASQGIFLRGRVKEDFQIVRTHDKSIRYIPQYLRHTIQERIGLMFSGDCEGLMKAFLAGDRSGISDGLDAALRRTGLSHLVAVSGLHVMFLVNLILFLTQNNRWCKLLCIPLLVLFSLATGCTPSAMRAVLMECILLAAPFFRREEDGLCSISAALIVLLFLNPFAITSVSLQLSFASMLGIVLFADGFKKWMKAVIPEIPFRPVQLLSWFIQSSISLTIAASVFTLPLSAYYFGTISLISVLSNLLVVSAAAWLFFAGALAVMVSLVSVPAALYLVFPAQLLSDYVVYMAKLLERIPFGQLNTGYLTVRYWLLAVCAVVFLTASFKWLRRHWYVSVLICAAMLCGTLYYVRTSVVNADIVVQVLDVGQGQSVLFYSEGETVAVDCGGNRENAGDILVEAMVDLRVSHLNALMLTHYDSDHINGLEELLRRVQVDELLLPDIEDDQEARSRVIRLSEQHSIPITWVGSDETRSFGEAEMQIFAPVSTDSDNEACLSTCISSEETDILITGDMGAAQEEMLVAEKHLKDIEVLVVAHHGSRYSTSETFLNAIRPDYAVISVGNNNYGHPTEETLVRLTRAGCKILRTDENGTVTLRFQEE